MPLPFSPDVAQPFPKITPSFVAQRFMYAALKRHFFRQCGILGQLALESGLFRFQHRSFQVALYLFCLLVRVHWLTFSLNIS
ncbi:MAG: hypothetical protein KF734_12880 [Saprospiraceae bacterium]|nr:hypothetical protein [Saprospiraceae bacterium]